MSERNTDFFMRSTGLYILDFDFVSNLVEVWNIITRDPTVAIAFVSITGSGLKICVRGPLARNAIEYSENYERIAALKSQAWGLQTEIDRATKDCSRLCFLAYDPKVYHNWDAVALTVNDLPKLKIPPKPEQKTDAAKTKITGTAKVPPAAGSEKQRVEGLPIDIDWGEIPELEWEGVPLARCLEAMCYINPCCGRETWRIVGAALKLAYGEDAKTYFVQWSSHGSSAYTGDEDCQRLWDGHKRDNDSGGNVVTPKSILKMARKNGWCPPDQRQVRALPELNVSSGRDWNPIAADVVKFFSASDSPTVFLRDSSGKHMVEVITKPVADDGQDHGCVLSDVRPVDFASLVSRFARLVHMNSKGGRRRYDN